MPSLAAIRAGPSRLVTRSLTMRHPRRCAVLVGCGEVGWSGRPSRPGRTGGIAWFIGMRWCRRPENHSDLKTIGGAAGAQASSTMQRVSRRRPVSTSGALPWALSPFCGAFRPLHTEARKPSPLQPVQLSAVATSVTDVREQTCHSAATFGPRFGAHFAINTPSTSGALRKASEPGRCQGQFSRVADEVGYMAGDATWPVGASGRPWRRAGESSSTMGKSGTNALVYEARTLRPASRGHVAAPTGV